jgi:hypothetical protein
LDALRIIPVAAANNLTRVDGVNRNRRVSPRISVASALPFWATSEIPAMNILSRTMPVVISIVLIAVPARAQVGSGVLNRLGVQHLAAAETAGAHAALAKHFIALAAIYRADAARYSALAASPGGNPNHPFGTDARERRVRQANAAAAAERTVRDVAAYHLILAIGGTWTRPVGAPAFDGGAGAPPPTPGELDEIVRAARTPAAHRELVEYFLIVAHTQPANAEAYAQTARMARVSGGRNTESIAAGYEYLARTAREAARRAKLAVELHRQLAAIG